jgi:hypothetical protein
MARPLAATPVRVTVRPGSNLGRRAPAENEAGEEPVKAEPRLDRSVFLYMAPRDGFDGKGYFGQCSNCAQFVPEASMHGTVRGARCVLLGSEFSVTDDSSCGFWQPWAVGVPCQAIVDSNAAELARGLRGAVSPSTAGYVYDTRVRCQHCRMADMDGDGTGIPECELYQALNEALPEVFDLDKTIEGAACCNAWVKIPEPEGF